MKDHPSNIPSESLDELFRHHPPTEHQIVQYTTIREAGKIFAEIVARNAPFCADRLVALRHIREAVMYTNAAIALQPQDGA